MNYFSSVEDSYIDFYKVLNRDLKYLNNRETGKSWDLSGTPYLEFGTWSVVTVLSIWHR